jgi:hypothetical protein
MKKVLQKLEKSNFIKQVHKQVIVADTINFIDTLKSNKNKFLCTKVFKLDNDYLDFMDLRIKSTLILSGFYDYLHTFINKNTDDIMLTCNIDNNFTFLAFKNIQKSTDIIEDIFLTENKIPIHLSTIDLDYETKIHILMYDNKFQFPGFSLN